MAVFAAAVALAAVLLAEAAQPMQALPDAPPPRLALSTPTPVQAPVDKAGLAQVLLTRPLFSPTRRPAASANLAAGDAGAPAAVPRLAGTMINGWHDRVALIETPLAKKVLSVHVGDTVGPFRITRIGAGEVMVESPGGQVTLLIGGSQAAASVPAALLELERRATGAPDQDE